MRKLFFLLLCIILLNHFCPSFADDATPTVTSSSTLPTLAQSLGATKAPDYGILLAVGADRIPLAQGATFPASGASLGDVALAFGMTTPLFGTVLGCGPPEITVLNADIEPSADSATWARSDVMTIFADLLTDDQWKLFISDQGIGYADLTAGRQQGLFRAILPDSPLQVAQLSHIPSPSTLSDPGSGSAGGASATTTVANNINTTKYRLGMQVSVMLRAGGNHWVYAPIPYDPAYPKLYRAISTAASSQNAPISAVLRTQIPNPASLGQLDPTDLRLMASVRLGGLHTVGDLIAQISTTTGLEIYADKHYDGRSLTVLSTNSAPTANARDLLQALAFDLGATYRQVAGIVLLTNNIQGVGHRRADIAAAREQSKERQHAEVVAAGDLVYSHHSFNDLSAFGDPLALTDDQRIHWTSIDPTMTDPPADPAPPMPGSFKVAYHDLDDSQTTFAQRLFDALKLYPGADSPDPLTPNTLVNLYVQPVVQAVFPDLDAPVVLGDPAYLFKPTPKRQIDRAVAYQSSHPVNSSDVPADTTAATGATAAGDTTTAASSKTTTEPSAASNAAAPSISSQVAAAVSNAPGIRAVYASPADSDDLKSLMPALTKLGFSELWLNVFSGGQTRLHSDPKINRPDILTEAGALSNPIQVLPCLDLFVWDSAIAADSEDLSIRGLPSDQDDVSLATASSADSPEDDEIPPGGVGSENNAPVAVSPFSDAVNAALKSAVAVVSAYQSIHGFVLRQTTLPGYGSKLQQDSLLRSETPLGYTVDSRAAFIRQEKVDPIDVTEGKIEPDTALPDYDDPDLDGPIQDAWNTFRAQRVQKCIRDLSANISSDLKLNENTMKEPVYSYDAGTGGYMEFRSDGSRGAGPIAIVRNDDRQVESADMKSSIDSAYGSTTGQAELTKKLSGMLASQRPIEATILQHLNDAISKQSIDGFVLDLSPNGGFIGGVDALVRLADSLPVPKDSNGTK